MMRAIEDPAVRKLFADLERNRVERAEQRAVIRELAAALAFWEPEHPALVRLRERRERAAA
jgi:hypothetical protein